MSYLLDTDIQRLIHTPASEGICMPKTKQLSLLLVVIVPLFAARLIMKYGPGFMDLPGLGQFMLCLVLLFELGITTLFIFDLRTKQELRLDAAGFSINSLFNKARYEWTGCSPFIANPNGVSYSYNGTPKNFSAAFFRCKPRQLEALFNYWRTRAVELSQ